MAANACQSAGEYAIGRVSICTLFAYTRHHAPTQFKPRSAAWHNKLVWTDTYRLKPSWRTAL